MQYTLPLLNMQGPPRSSKPQQLMRTVSISILVMSLPVLYVSYLHVPPAALFRDTTFWFLMSNSIIIVIAADSGMLFFGSSSSTVDDDSGPPFVVSGGEQAAVKNGLASTAVYASDEVVLPVEVVKNQASVVREQGDLTVIAENDHAYALVVGNDQAEQVGSKPAESREIMLSPSTDAGARPRLTASRSLAREERTRRRHSHRPSHSHALVPVQDKSVVVREEKQLRRTATEGRPTAPEEQEKESEYSRLSDEELNRKVEEFITRFNREIKLQLEKEQAATA
ncbi:uncharacterized protein LOC133905590 [Phragmites australis]|uniref:uncharacterized protein LOC133905590 n=1 Tax=Phragmites australis TaxID=29695 RepID=UPI002D76B3C8|nr:uncharacterized protein LOC133905590 [Phragmites australis]